MYLLDSNLFLELLLDQRKADEVEQLLQRTPREKLHISEFSVHSMGITFFAISCLKSLRSSWVN